MGVGAGVGAGARVAEEGVVTRAATGVVRTGSVIRPGGEGAGAGVIPEGFWSHLDLFGSLVPVSSLVSLFLLYFLYLCIPYNLQRLVRFNGAAVQCSRSKLVLIVRIL